MDPPRSVEELFATGRYPIIRITPDGEWAGYVGTTQRGAAMSRKKGKAEGIARFCKKVGLEEPIYHHIGDITPGPDIAGSVGYCLGHRRNCKGWTPFPSTPQILTRVISVAGPPWGERRPVAVMRTYQVQLGRVRIAKLSLRHPDLLDAKLHVINHKHELNEEIMAEMSPSLEGFRMNPAEQVKHCFIVDYAGTGSLVWKFSSGSVVIRVRDGGSPVYWFDQFFEHGVHCMDVEMEELIPTIEWLREHPRMAQTIGINGRERAFQVLNSKFAVARARGILGHDVEV